MKRQLILLLLMMLFVLTPFGIMTASAETIALSSRNDETDNRLTIHFYVQINGVDTPLPGAKIGIYQAAALNFDTKGNACYELLPAFQSLAVFRDGREVTFDGVTGTDADKLVKQLDACSTGIEQSAVTDENGDAVFNDLASGIYIVKELDSSGMSDDYELFEPYYIAVPYGILGENGYEWNHEVISDPKTVIKHKESSSDSSFPSLPSEPSVSQSSVSQPVDAPSDLPASGESASDSVIVLVIGLTAIPVSLVLFFSPGKKRNR